jgi:hypothetical protein
VNQVDRARLSNWQRRLLSALLATLGLVAIVGSGGGDEAADCSFWSDTCTPDGGPTPQTPSATIGPRRVAVQVGGTLVFRVESNVLQPAYKWCRLPAGESNCKEIAGATRDQYTFAGANLADDRTTFRVTVTGSNGIATAFSSIAVSSMPGVVFEDGDFLETEWAVSSVVSPPNDPPTYSAVRAETGGHPDAFRTATYTFSSLPSSVGVYYGGLSAVYEPAVQGAIYVVDFSEDCLHGGISKLLAYTAPMIEQAGRRFVATKSVKYCVSTTWTAVRRASLGASDFELVEGPGCAAGESCPDFSSSGAPIRLGLTAGAEFSGGLVLPVQTSHGFDNWKATIWRR